MSRTIKPALYLSLLSVRLFAQQSNATLRVEVLAEVKPVPGATVIAHGLSQTTNANGIAVFSIPLGKIEARVAKEGFFDAVAALDVDEPREWSLSIELHPKETVEEEITVYATRTDTRLQDLPTRVEVLNREEIEEKMLMTPGDIMMMLNETGGLRVQTTSPSLGAASVRIQGMRGRYTRFLADGLPLFGQQGGGLGILQIPPTDLGQVEVIKGVASALYGAGAMGGVVNLISRRPTSEPVHEFLLNRTTLGGTDASIFLASQLSARWSASFLGTGDWQEQRDIDKDKWADIAGYSRGVFRPRLFWDNGRGSSALLVGGVTIEDRNGGTQPGGVLQATGAPYVEALDTRRYDLGATYQFTLHDRYIVSTRFAGSLQNHVHRFGEIRERDRHEMLFGEVSLRGAFGRHTWVAGAAADRDAYRPRDVPQFGYTYVTPGIFAQDDIALAPWFSLSASARADFNSQYGIFLSPRFSALFRAAGWTSRLSVGQGFLAATPLTEETEAAGLTRLTVPRGLVAERGRSVSIDLSRKIGPVFASMTAFGSHVRNPIRVDRATVYQLTNAPQPTDNRGAELLVTWRKSPVSITASYTYVLSKEWEAGQRVDVPLTPRHSAGLTGVWEKEAIGRVGAEFYYTGAQRLEQNPYLSTSRPYISVGFLAEKRFGPIRLFINAENLTNVRQTRTNSLLRPTRAVDGRWTVDAWAPLDGRVFNGGIRFRL